MAMDQAISQAMDMDQAMGACPALSRPRPVALTVLAHRGAPHAIEPGHVVAQQLLELLRLKRLLR